MGDCRLARAGEWRAPTPSMPRVDPALVGSPGDNIGTGARSPVDATQRAFSVTQQALSVTQRAFSVT
jgi:hypothetical protein